jgi:hypothetical protein
MIIQQLIIVELVLHVLIHPTQAIVAPYIVDGSKCISYFTIELKEYPAGDEGKFDDWALVVIYVKMFAPGTNSLNHTMSL